MPAPIKTALLLLALMLSSLLLNLGDRPVSKIQEVRVAETAREMVVSGDWILPRYNGEYRLQKPPIPYWLTGISYELFGVNETAVRVPAVCMGILTALLLCGWLNKEAGLDNAAGTVLVLATSYLGMRYLRSGEADAVLMFFIASACILGYKLLSQPPRSRLQWLFGLALGLGFLTKGPAALAVPLLTLAVYCLWQRQFSRLRSCFSLAGLVLFAITAFGWYAWLFWQLPDAAHYVLSKQIDETFISGTHAKSHFWYVTNFFGFFAPWGFLLIPAAWRSVLESKRGQLKPHVRFAWIWLAVVFVLLMLTVNKQMQYAVLFLPSLAILLGDYLANASGRFAVANRALFGVALLVAVIAAGYAWHKGTSQPDIWMVILALPLVAKALLRTPAPSYPLMIVAVLTSLIYLYAEANFSKEPNKIAAQTLASKLDRDAIVYQMYPGDGAYSFYAGRVITPLVEPDVSRQLAMHQEILLIAEGQRDVIGNLHGVRSEVVETVGDATLYRLRMAE